MDTLASPTLWPGVVIHDNTSPLVSCAPTKGGLHCRYFLFVFLVMSQNICRIRRTMFASRSTPTYKSSLTFEMGIIQQRTMGLPRAMLFHFSVGGGDSLMLADRSLFGGLLPEISPPESLGAQVVPAGIAITRALMPRRGRDGHCDLHVEFLKMTLVSHHLTVWPLMVKGYSTIP